MIKRTITRERIAKSIKKAAKVVMAAGFLAAALIFAEEAETKAVTVKEVNYENSTMTVKMNAADNYLYISNGQMKKWECVPGTIDSNHDFVMDISWIPVGSDYTMTLKGDSDDENVEKIIIRKQATKLSASYNMFKKTITFKNADDRKIEWKKKDALMWQELPSETVMQQILDGLCMNGATILFRLAPENGTSAENAGLRASKEVSVNIAKKSAAPTVTINNEKMTIPVKKGMEYRYADEEGNAISPVWSEVSKDDDILLESIAGNAMCDSATGDTKDVYIQFRTAATSSKQVSNITTIKVPAQKPLGSSVIDGIKLKYTSLTTFEISVSAADSTNPFEYCIIKAKDYKEGTRITSLDEIEWKEINSKSPVVIDQDKDHVETGSQVYVRRKAYGTQGETSYRLASTFFYVGEVKYPHDIETYSEGLEWLRTIAGVCSPDNPEGYLTFNLYSETESVISKLEFVDYSSQKSYGTVQFKSNVYANPDTSDTNPAHRYIINTQIISTENLDNRADDENTCRMLAYMTIGSAVTKSDETKGIALYLYPATKVNNPATTADKRQTASLLGWSDYDAATDKIGFTTAIERIYNSNRIYGNEGFENFADCDQNEFRVRLDLGTRYLPDYAGEVGSLSENEVNINKIKYDGASFTLTSQSGNTGLFNDASGKTAFKAEYANTKTDDNRKDLRFAVVTIYADVIEKNGLIDDRNVADNFTFCLNNGEIIDSGVTMNLEESASVSSVPTWTVTAGNLQEAKTVSVTDSQGNTTVSTEKVKDHYIDYKVLTGYKNLGIVDVTWNGISVLGESDGTRIYLSNTKINKIEVGTTQSFYLVITFDNGFSINRAGKLTIMPSSIAP